MELIISSTAPLFTHREEHRLFGTGLGREGVLCKSLGRGVPLGQGNPYLILDHDQLVFCNPIQDLAIFHAETVSLLKSNRY